MKNLLAYIRRVWTGSIRRQLIMGIALVHAVLMTFFVFDLVSQQRDFLQQQNIKQTTSLVNTVSANSVSWVLARDFVGLNEIIQSVRGYPNLRYAMVLAPDGRILAHSDNKHVGKFLSDKVSRDLLEKPPGIHKLVENSELTDIAAPVISNDKLIGWARVAISGDEITASLTKITYDGIGYTLLAILVGIVFAIMMAKGITASLARLVDVAAKIREGQTEQRVELERNDELGELGNDFNHMLDVLDEQRNELEQHREHLEELVNERTATLEVAYNDLKRARDEAVRATNIKSEFLAKMSHELRTPLNSIIGFTGIIKDGIAGPLSEEQSKQLSMVYDSAMHLLGLINDILDISKVEAGKMELHFESFDLPDAIQEVRNVVTHLAEKSDKKNVELIFDMDCSLREVYSDKGKIHQILLNLLSNAIKFTNQGTVTLGCMHETDSLSFIVKDTGIGIPKDKQDDIFESFQQVDNSEVRNYEGTGLGLTITRQFVELMGGTIKMDSEENVGTKFEVHIPVTVVPIKPTAEIHRVFPGKEISHRKMTKEECHILVVDDDKNALELMRNYLQQEGYQVTTLSDSRQAVEKVKAIKPMVVTLDVQMPDLDGWATLAALKSDNQTSSVPVVMISMLDKKNLGLSLGAVDFLQKPIEPKQLSLLLNSIRIDNNDVLIIEDRKPDAEMLEIMLNQDGYQVRHAADGVQALEMIANTPPAVILLDLMMPQMSGFEVVQRLRASSETRDIPIIVVSAKHLTEAEAEYLSENVEKVLVKGELTRNDMLHEVGSVISHICSKQPGDISG